MTNRSSSMPAVIAINVALGFVVRAITPYTLFPSGERYRYVDMSVRFPYTLCPSFHCFRFLPPLLTRLVPLPTIPAFIVTGVVCQMLAGVFLWRIAERLSGSRPVALWTTFWFWGSWATIQTLGDPLLITDPVQMFWSLASLDLLLARRFRTALVMLAVGAGVKESVLLVPCVYATYTFLQPRAERPPLADLAVLIALPAVCWLAIRAVLSRYYWYALNEDAGYIQGTYLFTYWLPNLAAWPKNLVIAALYVFGSFGLAWVFAAGALKAAPRAFRSLALASIPPMLFLAVYQIPDRALASFPYAILPLAAVFVAPLPVGLNALLVFANAVFTERLAATASWAPRLPVMLPIVAVLGATAFWWRRTKLPADAVALSTDDAHVRQRHDEPAARR